VTIVGLVRDNKYNSADEDPMPMAWYSYQQDPNIENMDVEVRTAAIRWRCCRRSGGSCAIWTRMRRCRVRCALRAVRGVVPHAGAVRAAGAFFGSLAALLWPWGCMGRWRIG